MKTVILSARYDTVTGTVGLVCGGLPDSDDEPMVSNSGVLIAHDLVEHVNGVKNIGSIKDELQALGAVWFTRGQWGDISRVPASYHTPYESLGMDVSQLALKFITGYGDKEDLHTGMPKREKKDYIQENINSCLEEGKKGVLKELEYNNEASDTHGALLAEFFSIAGRIMRKGYDKIERKFESGLRANSLFWSIANAVDEVLGGRKSSAKIGIDDKYKLRYDPKGLDCDLTSFNRIG